jgi:hypothetical protein
VTRLPQLVREREEARRLAHHVVKEENLGHVLGSSSWLEAHAC